VRARSAAEIALKLPEPAEAKAQAYFRRACGCLRSGGKVPGSARGDQHGAALPRSGQAGTRSSCPFYGRFTGGFDTVDLKEAKALLGELHA
jgi:hypothetical protein